MEKMYKWSKNGNKMLINTGYKTFDNQTNLLTAGAATISNTQYSNYIRPYSETINPVGEKVEQGQLKRFDLRYFSRHLMDDSFLKYLDNLTKNKGIILYEYFIFKDHKRDPIGWIIEDPTTKKVIKIQYNYFSKIRTENKRHVLNFCKNFIEYKENN